MPRTNLIRTDLFPYHITIRTNNRDWFDLPLEEVWRICIRSIKKSLLKHKVDIQAFVLMDNHYHLMLWTPDSNIDKFMYEMNSSISKDIRKKTGRINRIFGDRYKWSLVKSREYYVNVLRYIYQNPLGVNLVKKCEHYKYSTLHYHIRNTNLGFKLRDPILGDKTRFLQYINEYSLSEKYKIGKAISRPVSKLQKTNSSRRIS